MISVLIIGISGVTCGGKSSLAKKLSQSVNNKKNVFILSQDDYYLDLDDPRHVWIPELNHINFEIFSSLDMHRMNSDIHKFIQDKTLLKIRHNMEKTFSNSGNTLEELQSSCKEKLQSNNVQVLIIEGFSIFNFLQSQNLCHRKYYLTLSKEECYERRQSRIYEPADCPGYFVDCVWPEHEKQLKQIRKENEDVTFMSGTLNSDAILRQVLEDIHNILTELPN